MMLGKMQLEGTMYRGGEPTLAGELTPELLQRADRDRCPKARTSRNRPRPPASAAGP